MNECRTLLYSGLNRIIQNGMFVLESISVGVLSHKWEDLCVILTHKRTQRKLPQSLPVVGQCGSQSRSQGLSTFTTGVTES